MIRFYNYLSKAVIITFLGLVHMSPATRDDHLSEIHTLLDIECALCHVTGVQFDKTFPPINPPFLIFFKNYRLLLHKMSWGELILPL